MGVIIHMPVEAALCRASAAIVDMFPVVIRIRGVCIGDVVAAVEAATVSFGPGKTGDAVVGIPVPSSRTVSYGYRSYCINRR